MYFSISIAGSRAKNYVMQEVNSGGRFALSIISQKIRASNGVNIASSTFGSDPGVLSLSMVDAAKNPTIIDLSQDDGTLQITEGVASPITISSSRVRVTNLVFTNLSSTGSRENIRIEMTIDYNDNSGDVRYTYSKNWQKAVSLRQ